MDSSSVWRGLVYGGAASMIADLVTLPTDVVKTRLQLAGEGGRASPYKGAFDCALATARKEGVRALWKGLEPALWRQATYGSMRYGFYTPIKELIAPGLSKNEMHLGHKLAAGGLSGALSSALCNPCDLVKVRMMAPGAAAAEYRWFLPSMVKIARNEGVLGLWKGTGPTCARATALAAAELATYDHIKHSLLASGLLQEGLALHAVTAMAAGFVGALACNPFDVAKSRMMNAHAAGVTYKGMVDCMLRSARQEGVLSLWKGFLPAWARVGPRVVIIFVCMEQFSQLFGR